MGEDLSGTYSYRRDSFASFIKYWARFFFLIVIELPAYLQRHQRTTLAKRAFWGEMIHQSLVITSLLIDWRFGLFAFALPMAIARTMMMVGNWGQHAFINTDRKNNGFSNSITCINSVYNKRAFNDGYHIGHHMKANRHWTEGPQRAPRQPRALHQHRRGRLRRARLLHGLGPALVRPVEDPGQALRQPRRPAALTRRDHRALEEPRSPAARRRDRVHDRARPRCVSAQLTRSLSERAAHSITV
jgi:hypothetical protein